eukprot:m.68804 g.68804  ORF g.68804 m.68804 type:complete len:561 (+) comp8539_c0_seq1:231-1913(+)
MTLDENTIMYGYRKAELQEELRARGLSVYGLKRELQQRLLNAVRAESSGPASAHTPNNTSAASASVSASGGHSALRAGSAATTGSASTALQHTTPTPTAGKRRAVETSPSEKASAVLHRLNEQARALAAKSMAAKQKHAVGANRFDTQSFSAATSSRAGVAAAAGKSRATGALASPGMRTFDYSKSTGPSLSLQPLQSPQMRHAEPKRRVEMMKDAGPAAAAVSANTANPVAPTVAAGLAPSSKNSTSEVAYEWQQTPGSVYYQEFDQDMCVQIRTFQECAETLGPARTATVLPQFIDLGFLRLSHDSQPMQYKVDAATLTMCAWVDGAPRTSRKIRKRTSPPPTMVIPPAHKPSVFYLQSCGYPLDISLEVCRECPNATAPSSLGRLVSMARTKVDQREEEMLGAMQDASRKSYEQEQKKRRVEEQQTNLDTTPLGNPKFSDSFILAPCRARAHAPNSINELSVRDTMVKLLEYEIKCINWYPTSRAYFTRFGHDLLGALDGNTLQEFLQTKLSEVEAAIMETEKIPPDLFHVHNVDVDDADGVQEVADENGADVIVIE